MQTATLAFLSQVLLSTFKQPSGDHWHVNRRFEELHRASCRWHGFPLTILLGCDAANGVSGTEWQGSDFMLVHSHALRLGRYYQQIPDPLILRRGVIVSIDLYQGDPGSQIISFL
jgi:hypothetical protein